MTVVTFVTASGSVYNLIVTLSDGRARLIGSSPNVGLFDETVRNFTIPMVGVPFRGHVGDEWFRTSEVKAVTVTVVNLTD